MWDENERATVRPILSAIDSQPTLEEEEIFKTAKKYFYN
jgi:hypothetical protein